VIVAQRSPGTVAPRMESSGAHPVVVRKDLPASLRQAVQESR
jgi:hypothetical protein